MNVRSGKKHKRYACRMATPSSIRDRAILVSDPMGHNRTNLEIEKHDRYKEWDNH